MNNSMSNRFKNIYFWLGLGGVIFGAAGIDFNTLTSWSLLSDAFMDILRNPVAICSVIAGITGVCIEPTSRGLRDSNK